MKTLEIGLDSEGEKKIIEKVLMPYTHIEKMPGKKFRSRFIKAFNKWLNVSDDIVQKSDEIMQMLHNSSLLIDDIQDNSELRRGKPVAHAIYGIPSTMNAAMYVITDALKRTMKLGHPDAVDVYSDLIRDAFEGQGIEIYWRENSICPTEAEYIHMIKKKTGSGFSCMIRLLQLFSENKADLRRLGVLIGLYFQIRDDYCNLWLQEYADQKTYCEDFSEGKFSFPIVHALTKEECRDEILYIIKQRPTDIKVKRYCLSLIEKMGSYEYSRETLIWIDREIRNEVAKLGGNPDLEKLFDELLNWKHEIPTHIINGLKDVVNIQDDTKF